MCRVVARPSFSKHEEAWEKLRQVPVGTFRRYAELEGGAIQSVLDGEIGTTEGGARCFAVLARRVDARSCRVLACRLAVGADGRGAVF